MPFYKDLYKYAKKEKMVGWLSIDQDYETGLVPKHLVDKLKILQKLRTKQMRGYHECELCVCPNTIDNFVEIFKRAKSSCEIHVKGETFKYRSPEMIIHYIEEHNYLPPEEYLEVLEKMEVEPEGRLNL